MINALEGKVALVTGGGRGIGAAVALRLAEQGADVALTYYENAQRADDVVDQIKAAGRRAVAMRADSADPAAVAATVDRAAGELGRLDILVNNAGAFLLGRPGGSRGSPSRRSALRGSPSRRGCAARGVVWSAAFPSLSGRSMW